MAGDSIQHALFAMFGEIHCFPCPTHAPFCEFFQDQDAIRVIS